MFRIELNFLGIFPNIKEFFIKYWEYSSPYRLTKLKSEKRLRGFLSFFLNGKKELQNSLFKNPNTHFSFLACVKVINIGPRDEV